MSIDETTLSNGELYTIVTNKEAKGRKGAIVAMIKGTVAEDIITVCNSSSIIAGLIYNTCLFNWLP